MNLPGNFPMAQWLEAAWLNRYLDRELDEAEQEWFETYMLDKPRLLEQVDSDTRLREGLASVSGPPQLTVPAPPNRTSNAPPVKRRTPAFAIAASVLLGVGLGTLLPALRNEQVPIISSPPRMVFDTLRGDGARAFSEAGAADSNALIVDIATPPNSRVHAAHAWVEGKAIELPTPIVSSEGFVTFVVPATWRGHARIDLELGDSSHTSTLHFQL